MSSSLKIRKALIHLIRMGQRPEVISASGLAYVNNETLVSVSIIILLIISIFGFLIFHNGFLDFKNVILSSNIATSSTDGN